MADLTDTPTAPPIGGQYSVSGAHWSCNQYISPVIGTEGTDCALSVHAGSQAGIGFITVIWAELPASSLA